MLKIRNIGKIWANFKENKLKSEVDIGGISKVDILMATNHLYTMLKSGITLVESLEILQDQAKGKLKKVLNEIKVVVESGESFYKGLERYPKYFSPIYISMVKIGEMSGNLEKNLKYLATHLRKSLDTKQKVKSAMMYPTLIFIAIFGLGMSIALFVLPKILPLFKTLDIELPLTTRGLIFVAEFFDKYGFYVFIGMIVFIIFVIWLLRQNFVKPITHRVILKLPMIKNIVKNVNLENITRNFGLLLDSGLTINRSLLIIAESTKNRVYQKAIEEIVPEVEAGNSISEVFNRYPNLFPVITSRMIGVGERSGSLGQNLKYIAKFYEDMVDKTIKNLSKSLEPILLIVIGIVVGTVAISILGPIYEITGNLRK